MESAPNPQGRGGSVSPRAVANPVATRLAERLREIATTAAAPEDMLEPALHAVLEASLAGAGALCLFDQRQELLRLAAEVGLSDEGCKRLRQIRRGGTAGWDMPLHGLLNRRAYLIESAARNRYVPQLVDAAAKVTTIACVPLYAGPTPVASIVMVAVAPARITEEQLGPLAEPLRELAGMIEGARRRGLVAAPANTTPLALVRTAGERDKNEAARVQALVTSLAETERELARLAAALDAATVERDRLSVALAAVQAERDHFAAEGAAADAAHARLEEALVREAARRIGEEASAVAPPTPGAAQSAPLVPPPASAPPELGLAPADIVVVDDDPAWATAAGEGRQVRVVPPGDASLASLAGTSAGCVVVNLAARGALGALATLRGAGSNARIWGCLAAPSVGRALPVGLVEPLARPVDPDEVLAAIRRHADGDARVLTVGSDADALISLRLTLVRDGMSVSMAWDAARAAQLLRAEQPEIVLIDLALPGRMGYALVAQLAACDPPPLAALIPGDDDATAAFAAALAEHAERMLPLGDFLIRVLGQ